jgi:DNA invertase Pin-like site-specific DNA recombinase
MMSLTLTGEPQMNALMKSTLITFIITRETNMVKAVRYIRTSSASNLEGDSESRQMDAIAKYADSQGYEIVSGAWDQAVKGSDSIHEREGFAKLITYCIDNDVSVILCENASRFARDVIVQELGYRELKKLNLQLIPVDAPDYFTGDSPSLTLIRQVLGAVSEFEKSNLVSKLRGARNRVKERNGKCEGRKSLKELMGDTTFISMIKQVKLLRKHNKTYASIAGVLASKGYVQPQTGRPFNQSQIMRLIKRG